eukprot:TRINITY_DN2542_c0_g1_i1.p1 TRINITY_DN2542_c0_g1~~TRINITY_DN2542_c0_g1_i1.p1  ORF type:complete len:786 (-),score=157.77 TRINITY_DN2542_c0_g1_i1:15-2372(-)
MLRLLVLLLPLSVKVSSKIHPYDDEIAEKRVLYYATRGHEIGASKENADEACRFLEAAFDIQPENSEVRKLATEFGCACQTEAQKLRSISSEKSYVQISSEGHADPVFEGSCHVADGLEAHDLFPTPIGVSHLSRLGLSNWTRTLETLHRDALADYNEIKTKNNYKKIADVNGDLYMTMREREERPAEQEMNKAGKTVCVAFLRELGMAVSEEDVKAFGGPGWLAVYPNNSIDETAHDWHNHEGSVLSMVFYVSNPEPLTPTTIGDPRGLRGKSLEAPRREADPHFHRPLSFYGHVGDVVMFPPWNPHRTHMHHSKGDRIVYPINCDFSKTISSNRSDPWQWPVATRSYSSVTLQNKGVRPEAAHVYLHLIHENLKSAGDEAGDIAQYMESIETSKSKASLFQDKVTGLEDPTRFNHQDFFAAARVAQDFLTFSGASAKELMLVGMLLYASLFNAYTTENDSDIGALDIDADFTEILLCFSEAVRRDASLTEQAIRIFVTDRLKKLHKTLKDNLEIVDQERKEGMESMIETSNVILKSLDSKKIPPELTAAFRNSAKGEKHDCGDEVVDIKQMWSSRVYTFSLGQNDDEELKISEAASKLLDGSEHVLDSVKVVHGVWMRNISASLYVVVCDSDREVWFADPRAAWDSYHDLGVAEPTAPFHRHAALQCSKGKAIAFPAWMAYQLPARETELELTARSYSVTLAPELGLSQIRLPKAEPLCQLNKKEIEAAAARRLEKQKRCERIKKVQEAEAKKKKNKQKENKNKKENKEVQNNDLGVSERIEL